MATEVERLVAVIEARDAQFIRKMDQFDRRINRSAYAAEARFKKMNGVISNTLANFGRGFVGGLAGGFAVGGFAAVEKAIKDAAKLGDIAQRTGSTTDFLQALEYGMEQAGGEAGEASKGLQTFARAAADATTGSNDLGKLLQANGIALTDAQGKLRPVNDLIADFADLVKNAKSPAEALEIATRGFGKAAGPELVGLLSQGGDAIRNLTKEATDAGAVMDEKFIVKAQEIDDAFSKLSRNIGTYLKSGILTGASALQDFFNMLDESAVNIRGSIMSDKDLREIGGMALRAGAGKPLGGNELTSWLRGSSGVRATIQGKPTKLPASGGADRENEFEREIEQITKRTELLKAEAEVVGMGEAARSRALAVAELQNAATQAGIPLNDTVRAQIEGLADAYIRQSEAVRLAEERYQDLQGLQREFGALAIDSIQGLIDGTMTLNDVLANTLKRFADLALQAAFLGDGPLAGLFGGRNASGGVGGIAGFLGQAFGGFFADGGNLGAGKWGIAGERGPEIIRGPANIVPMSGGGGKAGPTVHVAIDARGADAASVARLEAMKGSIVRQAVQAAVAAVPKTAGGRPGYYGSGR